MSIEEISSLISQRLLKGFMNHQQFANYYDFLGLKGYRLFHEYHFIEQIKAYREFVCYFIQHYNKLVPQSPSGSLTQTSIIPNNWYNYTREDVDTGTRRNAIKNGLQRYVHWERETKRFLEDMYAQAIQEKEIGLSIKIKHYIKSVEHEIKLAEQEYLEARSIDYDLPTIVAKQQTLAKCYSKKICRIRKEIDCDQASGG